MTELIANQYFACPIYTIDVPEFLDSVRAVSEDHLRITRGQSQLDEIYPVYMSGNYSEDSRVEEFAQFVADSAASILDSQGYDTGRFVTRFSEMWTQEHHKHSAMEQHIHSGSQIVGFYFLDVPDENTRVLIHDPRAGKVMIDLPQRDPSQITIASQMINFIPKPGMLMFMNSWLAHSFTRHRSEQPLRFVHFNLYADFSMVPSSQVEVV